MRKTPGKSSVFTILILGLVIVALINVWNVYTKGKRIADKIAYSSNYEELYALAENSFELKGDLFQQWRDVLEIVRHLDNIKKSFSKLEIESLEDVAAVIENHKTVISETADELMAAKAKLEEVDFDILPENARSKAEMLKHDFRQFSDLIEKAKENIPALENLLGIRYPHRYLILFQNNNEARPTGGFIGSVMLLDINDGRMTKSEVIDVYDLDGQFHEYIEPPAEIAELTSQWRLRDSNYWPDFSISGEKAAWFFQKEGGPSVDSVIAINQSILKDLLEITGPISVPGLQAPITGSNYDIVLSYIIESKLNGKRNPKEILKNFVPLIQKELLKKENFADVLRVIRKEIAKKNLLAYSRREEVEKFFDYTKSSGKMHVPGAGEDYLSVITTSISGNKSDKYIEQTLAHNTWISREGDLVDQIAVTRRHTWDQGELWRWRNILGKFGFTEISDVVKDVLGRGSNKSVVRVYVPNGSELLETTSIAGVKKVYDAALDKEYFMFRIEVGPGEEKTVVLDYKLPFRLNLSPLATYKLHVQKQPGNMGTTFIKRISGEHLQNHKNFPESEEPEYALPLQYDEYFASVWGKY